MRALSVHQPYPWAMCYAGKRTENRTWPPPDHVVNRVVALHATRHLDHYAWACFREGDYGREAAMVPEQLPTGAIVAVAYLAGWWLAESHPRRLEADPWAHGPVCWRLEEVRVLPDPVPCRGYQGLWRVPADVLEQVRRQLPRAEVACMAAVRGGC